MKFDDALSRVAWQDFEVLVANHYRDLGYDVMHCGEGRFAMGGASDVDLRLRKDGKLVLVQCRHESVSGLNANAIERLLATGADDGAAEVIAISSADIPESARQVGEAGGATLIDGVAVRAMLGERLAELHPVRALPGVDPQHGQARIVVRGDRRRGRPWWPWLLLAIALLATLAYYAPVLRKFAGFDAPPPQGAAPALGAPATQELPLPPPPEN